MSSLVREEEGAGSADPRVLIVPPRCELLPDCTFAVPDSWQLDPQWYRRNDMQDIVEHNFGVQLAKAQMIESAAGACLLLGAWVRRCVPVIHEQFAWVVCTHVTLRRRRARNAFRPPIVCVGAASL